MIPPLPSGAPAPKFPLGTHLLSLIPRMHFAHHFPMTKHLPAMAFLGLLASFAHADDGAAANPAPDTIELIEGWTLRVNPRLEIFTVSARSGEGLPGFYSWIEASAARIGAAPR